MIQSLQTRTNAARVGKSKAMTQMYTPAKQRVPQTISSEKVSVRIHPVQQERQKSRSTLHHTPHNEAFRRRLLQAFVIRCLLCPDMHEPAAARVKTLVALLSLQGYEICLT
jgi:hypothetical protein